MNWPKFADDIDYADYADFADFADYADHADYAEYAEYAEYVEYAEYAEYAEQGCISCGILVSGIRARGVSLEHMENMKMFSCSPT